MHSGLVEIGSEVRTPMFTDNIHHHSIWRQEVDTRLKNLAQWLQQHDLLLPDVGLQLDKMQINNRSDKIIVAFVAEFSRGKSELINAIFFADYGKRIMPASAGRTTMCPTELGYNERDPACLRLLPIQTRVEPKPLMEWRLEPHHWTRVDLDVNDPDQLIAALNKVAETIEVNIDEARALGFWHDGAEDNPIPTPAGMVEVPRWRHALINMDHPLLRKGLIILDTPGLNAIGAEPELTMSLIPQAQAVVFMLATDTGVTASDLSMWREFLAGVDDNASRFVVLNKIDMLWDALNTRAQNEAQIERQRIESARILGLDKERVMAVSAQKGLLAKVNGDAELLKRSQLDKLEDMLGRQIVERRHDIMLGQLEADAQKVREQVLALLSIRSAELTEQLAELSGLQGKSHTMVQHQRMRIASEQESFESTVGRAHNIRTVHHTELKQIYLLLGSNKLRKETEELRTALKESGFIKVGVKKAYADTFERLDDLLKQTRAKTVDMHGLFNNLFKQLNAEYGFTLRADMPPDLDPYIAELADVQASHAQYLGVGNLLKLSQPDFVDRLLRALISRLRIVFERALNDIERWSRRISSQIDSQLRERRRSLKRRLASITQAETAMSSLESRIAEIQQALQNVQGEQQVFLQQMEQLLHDTVPKTEPPVLGSQEETETRQQQPAPQPAQQEPAPFMHFFFDK